MRGCCLDVPRFFRHLDTLALPKPKVVLGCSDILYVVRYAVFRFTILNSSRVLKARVIAGPN